MFVLASSQGVATLSGNTRKHARMPQPVIAASGRAQTAESSPNDPEVFRLDHQLVSVHLARRSGIRVCRLVSGKQHTRFCVYVYAGASALAFTTRHYSRIRARDAACSAPIATARTRRARDLRASQPLMRVLQCVYFLFYVTCYVAAFFTGAL